MNIIKYSMMAVGMVMSFSGAAAFAGSGDNFPSKIAKQSKAIEKARKAKEISFVESQSLKKELAAIKELYNLYLKDKTISSKEAKTLNSKLNNSDVNLFRKKYD